MPHIPLPEQLPGITGLLEYRLDTAQPIRELTQILLRGESTLSTGERELIAALVSSRNCTNFCEAAHTKAADLLLGEDETARAREAGATDREIHDTVLISAAFCLFNRYVDGLATEAPTDPAIYRYRATRVAEIGYTHKDTYFPRPQ